MKREKYEEIERRTREFFKNAGIVVREEEPIEVVDFGRDNIEELGLQICVYINTERVCAKEMVLFPNQTCAEHKHIKTQGAEGKEETFRCRYGTVYLYVTGDGKKENIKAKIPPTEVSVFHEVILYPGDQYTIMPNTLHWFQAGADGAVISEFSTRSTDETDVFTDSAVIREVVIED